jgi:hypothetical protein
MIMMTMLRFLLLISSAMALVVPRVPYKRIRVSTQLAMSDVRGVSLDALQDHDQEGILMSKSIVAWLDAEVRSSSCSSSFVLSWGISSTTKVSHFVTLSF